MATLNSYVCLPEGVCIYIYVGYDMGYEVDMTTNIFFGMCFTRIINHEHWLIHA